jgi:hypothetical protein
MKSPSQPPRILSLEELQAFLEMLRPVVPAQVYEIAEFLVRTVRTLYELLANKNITVARLRRQLFGPSTEKTSRVASGGQGQDKAPGGKPKGKGHGRNSLERDFPGALRVRVAHPTLQARSRCGPDCDGKLYLLKQVRSLAKVYGQPFLAMYIWDLEGLRCNACQQIHWAPAPEEARGPKYAPTAASILAVLHYANGMPFHRVAKLQRSFGIPVPEAVQWEQVSALADQLWPVYQALQDVAARGELFHNDDTYMKILALLPRASAAVAKAASKPSGKKERTGVFTTGIVALAEGHSIVLYVTGRQHAGENLRDLLKRRPANLPTPKQMCDGLSRNAPAGFKTLLMNCLGHGRRKFVEICEHFPEECLHVLEELKKVYIVDATARLEKLAPQARLMLHQQRSLPVMNELKKWLRGQLREKRVEPNSALGKAYIYLLKRWKLLTRFLKVPGAPLDNNLCERGLKMSIIHRKNSLFYKTPRGAAVGDCLMSLIYTCQLAKVDPFQYLTLLQQHHDAVVADPAAWLPWNYQTALAAIAGAATAPCLHPLTATASSQEPVRAAEHAGTPPTATSDTSDGSASSNGETSPEAGTPIQRAGKLRSALGAPESRTPARADTPTCDSPFDLLAASPAQPRAPAELPAAPDYG